MTTDGRSTPGTNPFNAPAAPGEPTPEELLKALASNLFTIVTLNLAFAVSLKSLSKKLNKHFGVPVPELSNREWLSLAYTVRAVGTHLTHQTKLTDAQEIRDKKLLRKTLLSLNGSKPQSWPYTFNTASSSGTFDWGKSAK